MECLFVHVLKRVESKGWTQMGSVPCAIWKPSDAERAALAIEIMKLGTAQWLGLSIPISPCLLLDWRIIIVWSGMATAS